MKNKYVSLRLHKPSCPSCGSRKVCILPSLINYSKLIIDIICGIFIYPFVPYELRCKDCGYKFKTWD